VTTLSVSEDEQTLTLRSKQRGSESVNTRVFRRHTPHPLVGTWKLNVAKSKLGARPRQSGTLRFRERNEGLKFYFDGLAADGKAIHSTGVAAARRLDDRTWLQETLRDGKVVSSMKQELSADGRTLTSTVTSPAGNEVRIWERESDRTPAPASRAEEVRLGSWRQNPARSWRECAPKSPWPSLFAPTRQAGPGSRPATRTERPM
jgi:hypothetical protein